jgi:uncharacterized protein (TIGR03435 family)
MTTRIAVVLALACAASAQPPAFEVASVKIAEPITPAMVQSGRLQMGVSIDARNVRISQFSMYELITLAYQIKGYELSGPSWMNTQRYDVQAKLPDGASRGQVPAMLRTLLAERFGLTIHRETRDINMYVLVQAKGGHKMKPSTEEAPAPEPQIRGGMAVGAGGAITSVSPGRGDIRVTPGAGGNEHLESKRATMNSLASFLNRYCELPVIDMTELKGAFEIELDVAGEEVRAAARSHGYAIRPSAESADPAGVSLRGSLEKVGLKLETRKSPTEVIVVDKVEKVPTEN